VLVRDQAATTTRYWQPPQAAEDGSCTLDSAAAELRERLATAVSTHLVADVPVGTFLSGGLDSTAVTESLARGQAPPELSIASGRGE
jgi:asparagine synthase (glutamine-hydrolysing)